MQTIMTVFMRQCHSDSPIEKETWLLYDMVSILKGKAYQQASRQQTMNTCVAILYIRSLELSQDPDYANIYHQI